MAEADPDFETRPEPIENDAHSVTAKPKFRWKRAAIMISVPLLLFAGAGIYWLGLQGKVSTDNAYVQQDKVAVSAEVSGKIVEVLVAEGDMVSAGQLLFRVDPEPYLLQIADANAAIATAQANVIALSNDTDLTGADIGAAQADIDLAEANFERVKALWDRGFSTKADLDAAEHARARAREELKQALARQREARSRLATGSAVPGVNPQVAAAQARKAEAELALRRTEVRAPIAGRVAQAERLQNGQQIVSNLPVLTLVAEQTAYVEANFKETDLAEMQPGQRAKIELDAYPGVELAGHVESIGAGTGAEFSVLPAQNATGNWVKVTQRVPVRIAIDGPSPRRLIAGLSSEVTVYTSNEKQD
jgi:membrane fusion protein (multidrug efflux system)